MNLILQRQRRIDFEELGYQTMLQCRAEEPAKNICGLRIHAYADELQPRLTSLQARIEQNKSHSGALHAHLYDRPIPVNDAAMLTHSMKVRIVFALTILATIACLVGNTTTFYLFGFGLLLTLIMASGATALPLVVGHLAYERIVEKYKMLQNAVIVVAVVLCFAGLYRLAEARRIMMDKAAADAAPVSRSYVDGDAPAQPPIDQDKENSEAKVRETLGGAMLCIMIAADVMLGFLVGRLTKMRTDEDYAAWRQLRRIAKVIINLEVSLRELLSSVEIAKKRCTAGILRAQVVLQKRRTPYYRALTAFALVAFIHALPSNAQSIERYEGILIDTSGSISQSGSTDLFRDYLKSTKRLLMTERENTRLWVSTIAVDSFGSGGILLKGWTPDAHGVFTDDLNRARRELGSAFEEKSSGLRPTASGTDIFGGLWHLKALFESAGKPGTAQGFPKAIWIFSDMVNETRTFVMPTLLSIGPEQMLERAKTNGLVVPLTGYKIYIYGASPNGLTPQDWLTVKIFWTMYFEAAGAELVAYSAECDVQR